MKGLPIDHTFKYAIYTMKCTSCGKEVKIVWKDGYPLKDVDDRVHQQFINQYIKEVI